MSLTKENAAIVLENLLFSMKTMLSNTEKEALQVGIDCLNKCHEKESVVPAVVKVS